MTDSNATELVCNQGFGFTVHDCPDYGSMDCPRTVADGKCGVDMQYAKELLDTKARYYARRWKS